MCSDCHLKVGAVKRQTKIGIWMALLWLLAACAPIATPDAPLAQGTAKPQLIEFYSPM
jgi:hypothetical protein